MSFVMRFLVLLSFLISFNPLPASACHLDICPSDRAPVDPEKMIMERAELLSLSEIIISEIDTLIAQLGEQSRISRGGVAPLIESIDAKVKTLANAPALSDFQTLMKSVSKHHFKSHLSYQLPRFIGFDCSECGFGTHRSWANRVKDFCCPPSESECFYVGMSLFCGGIQIYAYQWILSPLTGWDCSGVSCDVEIPTSDIRRWALSLKKGLTRLNRQIESLLGSGTGTYSTPAHLPDAAEVLPTAPDARSVAGTEDPRQSLGK